MARCAFCNEDVDAEIVGRVFSGDVTAHENCLYFSSGLAQNGVGQLHAINGFLLEDINKELRRGFRIKCNGCHKPGGYVGCAVRSCRKAGHFPCLHRLSYAFQYFGHFDTYCPEHLPTQPHQHQRRDATECCICLTELGPQKNHIYCPCCSTAFHKICVQKQAWSAGLYHLSCAVCKDKESYCSEMLRMGIAVPERDAQWEVGEDYSNEDSKYCHVVLCLCPEGRSHSTQIGKYRMRTCRTCGQCRGHVACLRGDETNECQDCSTVVKAQAGHTTSAPSAAVTSTQAPSTAPSTSIAGIELKTPSLAAVRSTQAPSAARSTSIAGIEKKSPSLAAVRCTKAPSAAASRGTKSVVMRNKALVLSIKRLNSRDIHSSIINQSLSS